MTVEEAKAIWLALRKPTKKDVRFGRKKIQEALINYAVKKLST